MEAIVGKTKGIGDVINSNASEDKKEKVVYSIILQIQGLNRLKGAKVIGEVLKINTAFIILNLRSTII